MQFASMPPPVSSKTVLPAFIFLIRMRLSDYIPEPYMFDLPIGGHLWQLSRCVSHKTREFWSEVFLPPTQVGIPRFAV